ncbi:hypothetical protein [Secundilactobacillus odoratitofui]|nr:hypothetical protein [Secundilactobacillus odoratitofui]
MKLHKWIISLGVIMGLSLGIGLMATPQAKASSWHKGAPKVLKGTWRSTYFHSKDFSNFAYTRVYFGIDNKSTFGINQFYNKHKKLISSGCGWGINNKLHYRKLSKTKYQLVDYFGKSKDYHTVKLHGHKATISNTGTSVMFTKIKK